MAENDTVQKYDVMGGGAVKPSQHLLAFHRQYRKITRIQSDFNKHFAKQFFLGIFWIFARENTRHL